MRCLIVDDEVPARRELQQLLSMHADVEIMGEAGDVASALQLVKQHQLDVVFLDIHLAGESGFDFVAQVPEPAPAIVFVTAHDRYAVRGFECNALDYLLKPVEPERLARTIQRVQTSARKEPPVASAEDIVFLKGPSFARFVPWTDLHHIVSEGNYTRVFMEDGVSALVQRPFKNWLTIMPPGLFFQIHRTTIVRRTAVRDVRILETSRKIVLSDESEHSVSRSFWEPLRLLMDNRK